jgi:hypothetical protein
MADRCPVCGGGPLDVNVTPSGLDLRFGTGRAGTVSSQRDGDVQRLLTSSTRGATSSVKTDGMRVSGQVGSPVDVGRPGEPRVLGLLLAMLRSAGHTVKELQASDGSGEDGLIEIDGQRLEIQIVSAPGSGHFLWSDVSRGTATFDASTQEAAEWLHASVHSKFKLYAPSIRSQMLLAIDIGHFGVLATPEVLDEYLARFDDPSTTYGFGSVWLIGPTTEYCHRLGGGMW